MHAVPRNLLQYSKICRIAENRQNEPIMGTIIATITSIEYPRHDRRSELWRVLVTDSQPAAAQQLSLIRKQGLGVLTPILVCRFGRQCQSRRHRWRSCQDHRRCRSDHSIWRRESYAVPPRWNRRIRPASPRYEFRTPGVSIALAAHLPTRCTPLIRIAPQLTRHGSVCCFAVPTTRSVPRRRSE